MTYAFILKCQFPDGSIRHYVWQSARVSSRKDGEKWVEKEFAANEIVSLGMKKTGAKLIGILDGGEDRCDTYEESMKLHDAACKRAEKMDGKAKKPEVAESEPEKAEAA